MGETISKAKPLVTALRGETDGPVPIWLMRQAGRYLPEYREIRAKARSFLDFCYTPRLSVEATLQPVRRFGLDGAIIFSDILVIPDALGQAVTFVEERGPVLEALDDPGDLEGLGHPRRNDRLSPVYEAIARVSGHLPENVALIGFAGAPWTIASYMIEGGGSRDFSRIKSWAYGRPEALDALMEVLVEAIGGHLAAQAEAGAEVLQVFDSWAGAIPGDGFERWCIEPLARIARHVKSSFPDVPLIAFPRGAGLQYERVARGTGFDAVSIDSSVPLGFAREVLQNHVAVQGNLDPAALLVGGPAMREAVGRILGELGHGPFVFNLGHGVLRETPPEHVAELVAEVRGWGR